MWVALPAGAAAGTAVVLVVLLSGALTPRGTSQAATASAAAGSSQKAAGSLNPSGASSKPSSAQPTAAQVAAVDAAAARVRTSPKDVGAHLELAQAYTAAGAAQLSSIEYLAVTQLDHGNAVANTQLALVAFSAGQAAQAKKLVDAALTAHHGYPEALYARGVIELMGLRHTVAGERDLKAYLAAAPHGSHRASVGTLLAISSGLHQ